MKNNLMAIFLYHSQGYKDNMVNPDLQHLIPIQLYGKGDILFGNLEQICLFHNDVFLRDLENCIETTELIGLCFVQRVRLAFLLFQSYQNHLEFYIKEQRLGFHVPLAFFKFDTVLCI